MLIIRIYEEPELKLLAALEKCGHNFVDASGENTTNVRQHAVLVLWKEKL
jgi:hypothetical protein